jgi:hypothetical protein
MVKFILRHVPKGKLSYTFTKKKTRHKIPVKFTKTTIIKVPKQKIPVGPEKLTATQIELRSKALGDKSHRMKFGKDVAPSHIAEEGIRAESIAYPIQEKVFNRQLKKHLTSERNIVARKIKKMGANQRGMVKPTKVTPSYRVPPFKRKHTWTWATGEMGKNPEGISKISKHDKPYRLILGKTRLVESKKLKSMKRSAAIKAYNKADKEATKMYQKAMLRFSGRSKHSSTRINMMASKPIVHDKMSDKLIYSRKKNIMDIRDEERFIEKQIETTRGWGKDYYDFPDTDDMMVLTKKQQSKRYKQLLTSLKKKKK